MNLNERIPGTIKLIVVLMIGGFLGERILVVGKTVQFILVCLVCGILVTEVDKLNVLKALSHTSFDFFFVNTLTWNDLSLHINRIL